MSEMDVLLTLAALGLACLVAWWLLDRWRWRLVVGRKVLLNVADVSLAGRAVSKRGHLLSLADVTVFGGGKPRDLDGVVVLDRRNVLWFQVVS